jgi:hypothetical protein
MLALPTRVTAVSLSSSTVDLLAVIGVALGAVALLMALAAYLRLRRLRRDYLVLQDGGDRESFIGAAARQVEQIARLRGELSLAEKRLDLVRRDVAQALRHVAVVRYDAFRDMGGRMSFSAALLDDAGDGLVISAIHGRTETRSYAKGVKGGTSDQQLSPEERQAIAFATRAGAGPSGRQPTAVQPTGGQPTAVQPTAVQPTAVQPDSPSMVRSAEPAEVRLFDDDEVELPSVNRIEY